LGEKLFSKKVFPPTQLMICGLDLGSRSVKLVVLNEETKQITDAKIFETIKFYKEYASLQDGVLQVDLEALGYGSVAQVVATGYGRNTINVQGAKIIPELKAHTLGAVWQTGLLDFTLLDLGGQDSKIIKVRGGKMADFLTNDKCAASTGRYLENMAAVLGLSLAELADYTENPVELNATCAIFGESELIGRIVEGYDPAAMAAGVNYSIFKRIKPLLLKLLSETIVLTGGVAKGRAISAFVAQELNAAVVIPKEPQLNGAIGCAVFAL
jgi:predicted CoA-substrate-specific enzyme activase